MDDTGLFETEVEWNASTASRTRPCASSQEHYGDEAITKDAIFDFVYGVLHAPAYRGRFGNDLAKALPRIPMAADFAAFAEAGRDLATLHLGYETCDEYPVEVVAGRHGAPESRHFRLGERAVRFADSDKTVLIVNEHVRPCRHSARCARLYGERPDAAGVVH